MKIRDLAHKVKNKLTRREAGEGSGSLNVWNTQQDREDRVISRIREQTFPGPIGSQGIPHDTHGTVKRSYPQGSRGLRGKMVHRFPKTARGKSVVPDKPDVAET